MEIRLSSPKYKEKMYSLWQSCFGDDRETIDMFFKNSFSYENAVICTDKAEVVSQLFLLPEKLSLAKRSILHTIFMLPPPQRVTENRA